MTEPCNLTALEALSQIAGGGLTCERLVRSCAERISEREPGIGAWQYLDIDSALSAAAALDASAHRHALQGIPFGVKDIIDTAHMPTEYGSPIYVGNRPAWDAACVAITRAAGGILLGKTVSTEFAHRLPGKTRNPCNGAHTPGGSSSGSAAAVAAAMIPLAIGTQTGGSTIRPAAFCGVVGYKPTFGDFSLFGVREHARSFDTLGLFARSIDDIGLFRAVLLHERWEPLPQIDGAALRVGFCRTPYWDQADRFTRDVLERGASSLARAGARVADVALPEAGSELRKATRCISGFEFERSLAFELSHHREKLSKVLREGRVTDGLACTYDRYAAACAIVANTRQRLAEVFEHHDVLLAPSAPGEAPEGLASTGDPIFNGLWNELHVPVITIPAFTGPRGLPVGAQLVGWWSRDRDLLAAAQWVAAHIA